MESTAAVGAGDDPRIAAALEALSHHEHDRALRIAGEIGETEPFGRWLRFSGLVALERWHDAERELDALLVPGPAVVEVRPGRDGWTGVGWRTDPTAKIEAAGPFLRCVGLARNSRAWTDLDGVDNGLGTWVEFVVRRSSGGQGDCRVEIADGTVRETVIIDPGAVKLLSGGSIRCRTDEPHLYGLWVCRQESRLFIDGQQAIATSGLPGDDARMFRFGAYESGADAESHWALVRVVTASTRGECPFVPPMLSESVWVAYVEQFRAAAELREAMTAAVQARLAYPRSARIADLVREVLRASAEDAELFALVQRTLQMLPLADRRLLRDAGAEQGEVLVACNAIGVRFERRQTRLSALERLHLRPAPPTEHFWAIRDVTVEVRAGDLLGIIGRNGAGKTTLLHCLADVIAPDVGTIDVKGSALLLSVGSGFIPALTGRENIYLSGLYLGMTRTEINARFDEIVEFAELWDAIDRPVRTYSSGMMSRLQFALATTVNPDILLLDELLGAGDAAFTDKSRARMQQMLRRARAVVVVTHDTDFVRDQCTTALLLERGEVLYQGSPETAVVLYRDLLERKPKRAERAEAM